MSVRNWLNIKEDNYFKLFLYYFFIKYFVNALQIMAQMIVALI